MSWRQLSRLVLVFAAPRTWSPPPSAAVPPLRKSNGTDLLQRSGGPGASTSCSAFLNKFYMKIFLTELFRSRTESFPSSVWKWDTVTEWAPVVGIQPGRRSHGLKLECSPISGWKYKWFYIVRKEQIRLNCRFLTFQTMWLRFTS